DIEVEERGEKLRPRFLERDLLRYAGTVDEDVQPSERARGLVDEVPALPNLAQVRPETHGLDAFAPHGVDRRVHRGMGRVCRDVRSATGELDRDRLPDSLPGTGDERTAPGQAAGGTGLSHRPLRAPVRRSSGPLVCARRSPTRRSQTSGSS